MWILESVYFLSLMLFTIKADNDDASSTNKLDFSSHHHAVIKENDDKTIFTHEIHPKTIANHMDIRKSLHILNLLMKNSHEQTSSEKVPASFKFILTNSSNTHNEEMEKIQENLQKNLPKQQFSQINDKVSSQYLPINKASTEEEDSQTIRNVYSNFDNFNIFHNKFYVHLVRQKDEKDETSSTQDDSNESIDHENSFNYTLPLAEDSQDIFVPQTRAERVRFFCRCGRPLFPSRIVGGGETRIEEHPWNVQIVAKNSDPLFPFCGGSIINARYVLSAAHCFDFDTARSILVRVGHTSSRSPGITFAVDSIKLHPRYNARAIQIYDIAILRLAAPLIYGSKVMRVCLDPEADYNGRLGVITGWGDTSMGGQPSDTIKRAAVRVLDHDICIAKSFYTGSDLNPRVLCGRRVNTDTCQGDSGGPFVVKVDSKRFVQVGITSFGLGCARPNFPGVYTRVPQYNNWIKKQTRDGNLCLV